MPQQTHAQIIDQIAAINRNIRGVAISYTSSNLPAALVTFPATMVLLGPEDYGKFGPCEYWIRVFVADARTGNPSRAYIDCLSLSTAFHDTYGQLLYVGDRYVYHSTLRVKSGFGNTGFAYTLKWGPGEYYGFQINLPLASSIPGN